MAQASIYIADRLWERVRDLKDKQLINVSAVCQRALQAEVTRLELEAKGARRLEKRLEESGINLDLLAQRIREQRSDRYQVGYDALLEWAQGAEFAELRTQAAGGWRDEDGDWNEVSIPQVGVAIAERLCQERDMTFDEEPILEGWRDAMSALWTKLSERAESQEQMDVDDIPF